MLDNLILPGFTGCLLAVVKAQLQDAFGIEHTTLELECSVRACTDTTVFGQSRL